MKVYVTKHAIERATQRFDVRINAAEDWIRARFRGAKYIANTVLENGREGRLFAKDGVSFVLDQNENKIVTVYKPYNHAVIEKVRATVQRELTKAQRMVRKVERENSLKIAEIEVDLAQCKLRQLRARSPKVRDSIQQKIDSLYTQVDALNSEIIDVKREMTNIAKGVAAYL